MTITSGQRQLFAACPPGLESVVADELSRFGAADIEPRAGGVDFSGDMQFMWRANLGLRTPNRILQRIARFPAIHLAVLHRKARGIPWEEQLVRELPIGVRASCRKSRIYHSGAAAERIAEGIKERLRLAQRPEIAEGAETTQTVFVRIERDICIVSVDTSGENLHRRGYREDAVEAPIRENLAAAILSMARWSPEEPLVDPMCGSGTFAIEAALMAAGIAPGFSRSFAFERQPGFDREQFQAVREQLERTEQIATTARIRCSDKSERAIRAAQNNAKRAGVDALVEIQCKRVEEVVLPPAPGLVICNPPYGHRLGDNRVVAKLYRDLGTLIDRHPGWRLSLVTSEERLARAVGIPMHPLSPWFPNGGLRVRLFGSSDHAERPT